MGDRHVDLGVAWDPNLTWGQIGDGYFSLIGEAHVAWWHTHEGDVHQDNGEIAVTPVIRFIKEFGIDPPLPRHRPGHPAAV